VNSRTVCMALVLGVAVAVMAAAEPVGPTLQRASVNVAAGASQGSGAIVLVEDADGERSTWILTAEHVVRGLRQVRDVIGPEGDSRKQVSYRDAQVIQEQVADGRAVGEIKFDARVVSVDPRRDIALLRVRANFTDAGVRFYQGDEIPPPGTATFHLGSPGGRSLGGTASLTDGIISRIGVRAPDFGGSEHGIFDQTTCPALPGSSGGIVALRDTGEIIGILTLGLRGVDSFNWFVPIRSIRAWGNEIGAPWLLDPEAERPAKDAFDRIPLEVDPAGHASAAPGQEPTPAMERGTMERQGVP
jgi:S1-C subfamily serine protease